MKITIFTPLARATAIGRFSSLIIPELINLGHDVVVVRSEQPVFFNDPHHELNVDIVYWNQTSDVQRHLSGSDSIIYQIGDNYHFHSGCLEWLPHHPGLVCMHDFVLCNLFHGWAIGRMPQAHEVLRRWYGEECPTRFFSHQSLDSFVDVEGEKTPLTEWVANMAHGVVTHSSWGIDRVLSACSGPVEVMPLCYNKLEKSEEAGIVKQKRDHAFNVLTIGYVNSNKRAHSVIKAIGNSAILKKNTCFRLIGHVESNKAEELSMLAAQLDVNLEISGAVQDDELTNAIYQADVMSCLRWPALEAGSASLIESLLNGKPTLVTNTRAYGELPDDVVVKINPSNEIEDITSALERLYSNHDVRKHFGEHGKLWAEKNYDPKQYAKRLIDIVYEVANSKSVLDMVNYFANILGAWQVEETLITLEETIKPLRIFNT